MRKHNINNFYATAEQKKEYIAKITSNIYSDDIQFKMLLELIDSLSPKDTMFDTAIDLLCAKITGNISQKQMNFIDNLILRGAMKGLIKNVVINLHPKEQIVYKYSV